MIKKKLRFIEVKEPFIDDQGNPQVAVFDPTPSLSQITGFRSKGALRLV